MGRFFWLFELPSKKNLEAQRFSRLALVWLFIFIVVIRALVLVQFLLDLDYSEINAVKLTQFVFVQTAVLCLLVYLIALIWSRPHRMLLVSLLALSAFSLYQQSDIVSLLSTAAVIGFTIRLALGIYPTALFSYPKKTNKSSSLS